MNKYEEDSYVELQLVIVINLILLKKRFCERKNRCHHIRAFTALERGFCLH
jgi:hypothetical protein